MTKNQNLQQFRSLTYKDKGITTKTATTIFESMCRQTTAELWKYIYKTNATGKTKQFIQTTEQIAIRLIIKIRHPNNALF